ncbi:MAG: hypothetical protein ABH950_03015 [Candidatus Altiarchaeota archaeon]
MEKKRVATIIVAVLIIGYLAWVFYTNYMWSQISGELDSCTDEYGELEKITEQVIEFDVFSCEAIEESTLAVENYSKKCEPVYGKAKTFIEKNKASLQKDTAEAELKRIEESLSKMQHLGVEIEDRSTYGCF